MEVLKYIVIAMLLSGCALPIKISYKSNPVIYRIKSSKIVITKAIAISGKITEAQAIVLWEKYKLSDKTKFSDYLISANPWGLQDRYYIEFVERIKARSKILKRGYYLKVSIANGE